MENLFVDFHALNLKALENFKLEKISNSDCFNARFELYDGTAIDLYDATRELILKQFELFDISRIMHFYYFRCGSIRRRRGYKK